MLGDRYSLATARKLANTAGVRGVIRHFGTVLNQKYHREFVNPAGADFVEEDWDNLLILDGCRHDLFDSVCDLEGRSGSRRSLASDSRGFIQRNFIDKRLHDTVYVSGNPYLSSIPSGTFHYTNDLLESGWNEELGTVPPKTVVEATRDALKEFPSKRVIAHFMQPHYPFIGDLGRAMETGRIEPNRGGTDFGHTIWQRLQYGLTDLTEEEVWEVYAENLELVLGSVGKLLEDIEGKTVITADHGNLVGDRQFPIPVRGYGHPPDLFIDPLIVVPWFVIEGSRRTIEAADPVTSERTGEAKVQDRLEALGYK